MENRRGGEQENFRCPQSSERRGNSVHANQSPKSFCTRRTRKPVINTLFIVFYFVFIGLLSIAAFTNGNKEISPLLSLSRAAKTEHVSRMQLDFTIDGKDITAYYTGALVNNRPYGEGIYEFEDTHGTWSFLGTLENGAFLNGVMTDYPYTMSFEDDQSYSKYSGMFRDGQPSGEGIYTIVSNGNTAVIEGSYNPESGFTGHASNLSMSFVYNDIVFPGLYTGEYLDGQPDGNGSFESEGDLYFYYDGMWENGSILGPGQLHTNNAQINVNGSKVRAEYLGHIENGGFNGEGTLSINQEEISYVYSGNWKNNMYSGKGILAVSSAANIGYTYDGSWSEGVYDGQGSLIYDRDDIVKYVGNFEKGKYRPSLKELVICLCSAENNKVILADYTLQYLDNNQANFFEHTQPVFQTGFSYSAYAKVQSEENSQPFKARITPVQIREYDTDIFGYPVTEFIGLDKTNRVYYGYYIGSFDGIKSGDLTKIFAYPIGYSTYKSQDGKNISSLRFVAYDIEKQSK